MLGESFLRVIPSVVPLGRLECEPQFLFLRIHRGGNGRERSNAGATSSTVGPIREWGHHAAGIAWCAGRFGNCGPGCERNGTSDRNCETAKPRHGFRSGCAEVGGVLSRPVWHASPHASAPWNEFEGRRRFPRHLPGKGAAERNQSRLFWS